MLSKAIPFYPFLLAAVLHPAAAAEAIARSPVESPRPLMMAALASADGEAHGVMVGEMADVISRYFQTTSPINIDITTVKRYAEPGCARLAVLFSQEGVLLPGATAPQKKIVKIGINLCRDGNPPRSLAEREAPP
jgi:hypothetical protein